jgi:phage terminase large subunit-like protein
VSKSILKSPARVIRSPALKPSPTTDYVAIAIAYAEEVIEDRYGRWTGKLLRLAARRFLRDLTRTFQKNPPFVWSATKANAHCNFIEQLPHVEDEWETENIVLQPAQIFFIVQLFGFRTHTGVRRYTQALFCTARKNAKTTIAAGILLSCMCLEKTNGAQLISAATTGDQARKTWDVAKKMVNKRADLRATFELEAFAHSIARYDTESSFKPINAKASTQDGLNPSHVCCDEIHAHKTPDLINVLRSAAGARKNALWLYTTTEGFETPGPWPELREFAKRILQGVVKADHYLAVLWTMEEDDDELDESKWPKANPLIWVNPDILRVMRELAIEARNVPSTMAEFRIKRCNLPAASAQGLFNLRRWNRCAGAVDLDYLAKSGAKCFASIDLASTGDMNAWRLLWLLRDHWYTWGRFWVPEDQVKQRTESGRSSYQGWVEKGLVQVTRGNVTDYDQVVADIKADCNRFNPLKIGYDPWNAAAVVNILAADGLPMELFVQGYKSYNPAIKECERSYMAGNLSHGGDPVLRWNVSNVVGTYDANMNVKPDRKRSADKIDGACALFMCYGLALAQQEEGDAEGFFAAPARSTPK